MKQLFLFVLFTLTEWSLLQVQGNSGSIQSPLKRHRRGLEHFENVTPIRSARFAQGALEERCAAGEDDSKKRRFTDVDAVRFLREIDFSVDIDCITCHNEEEDPARYPRANVCAYDKNAGVVWYMGSIKTCSRVCYYPRPPAYEKDEEGEWTPQISALVFFWGLSAIFPLVLIIAWCGRRAVPTTMAVYVNTISLDGRHFED